MFVAEDEGLRIKELEGGVFSSMDPHDKEPMHEYAWMALEAPSRCYSLLEVHLLCALPI